MNESETSGESPAYLDVVRRVLDSDKPDSRPDSFELLGLRWKLLEGVFSPVEFRSTARVTEWLPYPNGGTMLEVGCGAGITSVIAAMRGCSVTAVDISPAAVENTRLNSQLHGVADRVRVVQSDLFSALGPSERFDLVFWNSNYIEAPADHTYRSVLERSVIDVDYATHRAFVREVARYVARGGRVLMGFTSKGNLDRLARLTKEAGLRVGVERRELGVVDGRPVERLLLELAPANDEGWQST